MLVFWSIKNYDSPDMNNGKSFTFQKPLREGRILSRPNRFIMMVTVGKETMKAHCPSTGRIGNIVFKNIPCLLSVSNNEKRKTKYTVEAFSLDPVSKKNKKWIGINQVKANEIVEHFIITGQLSKMLGSVNKNISIKREVVLGKSRIDFLVGNTYLEIKTPLNIMQLLNRFPERHDKFNSFERLIKHFGDLAKSVGTSGGAIVALCYFYDAPVFRPPATDKHNKKIKKAAAKAQKRGLENWQINFSVNKRGVSLIKYFRL
jgi:sugar fermentation stimulation protein A